MSAEEAVAASDLLRWAETLSGVARTGLGFTKSLYEQERFEEVLKVAADIRVAAGHELEAEVLVDNELSHAATVIEVRAPDAVGLLWRITRALHDLDLDITSAKVQTIHSDVVDSFYVQSADGRKVTDRTYLDEVERAIFYALGIDV